MIQRDTTLLTLVSENIPAVKIEKNGKHMESEAYKKEIEYNTYHLTI